MRVMSSRNRLFRLIDQVINESNLSKLHDYIEEINKNKRLFENVLVNEAKNANDRKLVENAHTVPLEIEGISEKIVLSLDFIKEAIIISDLFDINEIVAVDLLLTGESDCSSKPEFTRGLMTVLNYYNSQLTSINALKTLQEAKHRIEPNSNETVEAIKATEHYVEIIFRNDLFAKLVNLLKNINLSKDIEKLEAQKALGSSKHRRIFIDIHYSIRKTLSECLLIRVNSGYNPSKEEIIELINLIDHLYRDSKTEELNYNYQPYNENYSIDEIFVNLLTCIFNSLLPKSEHMKDTSDSENAILHPVLTDTNYQTEIMKVLKTKASVNTTSIFNRDSNYEISIIDQFFKSLYLNWVISLQKIFQITQHQHLLNSSYRKSQSEELVDLEASHISLDLMFDSFTFMIQIINSINDFHKNISWVTCIHNMVTGFIIYMPKHVKELFKQDKLYFISILELIGCLYSKPNEFFNTDTTTETQALIENLTMSYWCLHELRSTCDNNAHIVIEKYTRSFVMQLDENVKTSSLFKFIRDASEYVQDEKVYISYISMLRGLCVAEKSAFLVFTLLNITRTGSSITRLLSPSGPKLSWQWFCECLKRHSEFWSQNTTRDSTLIQSATALGSTVISPEESEALYIVIRLIRQVCTLNRTARMHLINGEYTDKTKNGNTNPSFQLPFNLIQLLACRQLPIKLKAEIIQCLNAFCLESEVICQIWKLLDGSHAKNGHGNPSLTPLSILKEDMDEIEPRYERYPITQTFLSFMCSIIPRMMKLAAPNLMYSNISQTNVSSLLLLHTEVNSLSCTIDMLTKFIFLKHTMRSYYDPLEKWKICQEYLRVTFECVQIFVDKLLILDIDSIVKNHAQIANSFSWCYHDPGYNLICQLLSDSPLLRMIITLLDHGYELITETFNQSSSIAANRIQQMHCSAIKDSISISFDLIWLIINVEEKIMPVIKGLLSDARNSTRSHFLDSKPVIVDRLSMRLMSMKPNYQMFIDLLKHTEMIEDYEKLARRALAIFTICIPVVQPHTNLLLMITSKQQDQGISTFVNCLDCHGSWDDKLIDLLETSMPNFVVSSAYQLLSTTTKRRTTLYLESARSTVLRLLIECLRSYRSPNFAQYLLGFNTDSEKSVKQTTLQEPGLFGNNYYNKTCLHSLLGLASGLEKELFTSPCAVRSIPNPQFYNSVNLADLIQALYDLNSVYHIFYLLASNSHTGIEFLRFLRNNYQFIFSHLSLLTFNSAKLASFSEIQSLLWSIKAYYMQIIAVEVRVCSNQQKKYFNELLEIMFGDEILGMYSSQFTSDLHDSMAPSQQDLIVYCILRDLNVQEIEDIVDFSNCSNRFKPEVLKEYLSKCVEKNLFGNADIIDVERLKKLIDSDVNMATSSKVTITSNTSNTSNAFASFYGNLPSELSSNPSKNQYCIYTQETEFIQQLVYRFNRSLIRLIDGKLKCLEAWQVMVEVMMIANVTVNGNRTLGGKNDVTNQFEMTREGKIQKKSIGNLVKTCLEKVLTPTLPMNLFRPFGCVCLILCKLLTQLILPNSLNKWDDNTDNLIPMSTFTNIESSHLMTASSFYNFLKNNDKLSVAYETIIANRYSSSEVEEIENILKPLLKLLIDSCVKISNKQQNTRIKFYACLTLLLQVVIRLHSIYPDTFESLLNESFYIISNFPRKSKAQFGHGTNRHLQVDLKDLPIDNPLYALILNDTLSTNTHVHLSSLAVLKCLIMIDSGHGQLMSHLITKGYLQSLVDSVIEDCNKITQIMKNQSPEHANFMNLDSNEHVTEAILNSPFYYKYQSKMALLGQVAVLGSGNRAMLQCGILISLSKCEFFQYRQPTDSREYNSHPVDSFSSHNINNITEVQIYSNLMRPILQLASTLLVSKTIPVSQSPAVRQIFNLISTWSDQLIGYGLLTNRNSLSANTINQELTSELIQLTDLFVLLLPIVYEHKHLLELERSFGLINKIRHGVSVSLSFLLELEVTNQNIVNEFAQFNPFSQLSSNEKVYLVRLSNQKLLYAQLLSNYMMIAYQITNINIIKAGYDQISHESLCTSHKYGFFATNIFSRVSSSTYQRQSQLSKLTQSISAGNKAPISLLIHSLLSIQKQLEQLDLKLSIYGDVLTLQTNGDATNFVALTEQSIVDVTDRISKLSNDQIRGLWTNIFTENTKNTNHINRFGAGCYGDNNNVNKEEGSSGFKTLPNKPVNRTVLVVDLVNYYHQLTSTIYALKEGCEVACYLLLNNLNSLKCNDDAPDCNLFNINETVHPLVELTRRSNLANMSVGDSKTYSSTVTATDETIKMINNCLDDVTLNSLQKLLSKYSENEADASFSKGIIHRIVRILKLN